MSLEFRVYWEFILQAPSTFRISNLGMSDVTQILSAIETGEPAATAQLLPLVYDELRKLAAARMAQESSDHTLQATALVHEAYLRLVDVERAQHWNSRGHFFAAAAVAMRRILVEQARHKASQKAGGGLKRRDLSEAASDSEAMPLDLLSLHEALAKLETVDRRKAELVKLRFFAGLTNEQAAEALGISVSTADNDWAYSKSWLRVEMSGEAGEKH